MQTNAAADIPATMKVAEGVAQILPEDVDQMLASILPQTAPAATASPAQRKIARFRVKWHADILIDGQNIYHGFISDISTAGASVYLDNNVHPLKPTLRIHIPPLSVTGKSHILEVSGKTVYVVYDGDKQLYRAAISFTRFHVESDMEYLEERLNKCHTRIPEH